MAAQMPEKNNKQTRISAKEDPRKSDYITNKVLLVFSGCLLGVLGLMFLSNVLGYSTNYEVGLVAIRVLRVVGLAAVVAGLLLMLRERKRGVDMTYRVMKGSTLAVFGAALFLVFVIVDRSPLSSIKFMYMALPAFAFMYLIYHSYQPEFFMISLDCSIAVGAVLAANTVRGSAYKIPMLAAVIVFMAVQVIGTAKVKSDFGHLRLGSKHKYVFDFSNNAYLMMFLTPVVMALLAAVGILMSGRFPVASMIAAGAYFFVTAVYYTVKLV
ncbi:MAG: hypothetical protein Q4A63_01270 [Butyricicoccus pullicaecorum]|nr:hypothetical protein [Butyricicoccus pullicaecorum]MDO4668426.1 hypothetical protein [Butyricicoccus pullicaecorum]